MLPAYINCSTCSSFLIDLFALQQVLQGNNDRHRVKLNYLPFPVIAQTILILQNETSDIDRNVAFRMELYGCEPGNVILYYINSYK